MSIAARNAILAGGGSQPSGGYWGLCFTAEQANSTVAMVAKGSAPSVNLLYSTDAANWSPFVVGTTTVTLASVGDKVWLKAGSGGNTTIAAQRYNNYFSLSGLVAASGSVMSLLNGEQETYAFSESYVFRGLFNGCTALTTAPTLPATTLTSSCYASMFSGCTALTTAPTLPATTLTSSCYVSMFSGCTALTTAPTLPATTLVNSCYDYMFYNCTALTTAPALPATALAAYCYREMFSGCTALTTAPALPATTLATSCYNRMFYGCTALTTAPALPATTLADFCYRQMFSGCTSLTTAPALPATTLAAYCYYRMFYGCELLNEITAGIITWTPSSGSAATADWLNGVAATGTFYCPTALGTNDTITRGVSACPEGWTVINTDA